MSELDQPWLLRAEAAAYLRLSISSLAHMASNGAGPQFYKAGNKTRYRKSDLDAWARSVSSEPYPEELQRYIAEQGGMSSIRRKIRRVR